MVHTLDRIDTTSSDGDYHGEAELPTNRLISTNLHQAMISMQEASVAFTLMVEVRNKLVESYQELMRMQV